MQFIPTVNRRDIDLCDSSLEKALLYFIREVQNLETSNNNLMEMDKRRVEQLKILENKLKEK